MRMLISWLQLILNIQHGKHHGKLCWSGFRALVLICGLWIAATLPGTRGFWQGHAGRSSGCTRTSSFCSLDRAWNCWSLNRKCGGFLMILVGVVSPAGAGWGGSPCGTGEGQTPISPDSGERGRTPHGTSWELAEFGDPCLFLSCFL